MRLPIVPPVYVGTFTAVEPLEFVKLKQLRVPFTLLGEASAESIPQHVLLCHRARPSVTF